MSDLDKIRDTLGRAQKYIRLAVGATKTDTGRLVFADEQIDLVFDLLRSLPLVEPGGESHTVWRCYDLVSGGAYVTYSREELERHCTDTRAHEPDPLGPPPHPSEHQTAQHTVWPDGSQHTGPWRPTSSDGQEPG